MLTAEQEVESLISLLKYIKQVLEKYNQKEFSQQRVKIDQLFLQRSMNFNCINGGQMVGNRKEQYHHFKQIIHFIEQFAKDTKQIVGLIQKQINYKSDSANNVCEPQTLETMPSQKYNQQFEKLSSNMFQASSLEVKRCKGNSIYHSAQIQQHQQKIDQASLNHNNRVCLNKIQSVSTQIHLKQYAQLIDFFVLQFDIDMKQYKVYGKQTNKLEKGARIALKDLLFSSNKYHFREKKRTLSMTQIHKLTSNPAVMKRPIILPSFQNAQNDRYTFIFETEECVTVGLNYFTYDRYYCFVFNSLPQVQLLNNSMKKIRSTVFLNRLIAIGEAQEVDCYKMKQIFQKTVPQISSMVQKQASTGCFKIKTQYDYYTKGYYVSSQLLSYSEHQHVSLVLVLFYFTIKQEKIILLTTSEEKHSISDVILDLLAVLNPLKYVYPIIQSTLTSNHCQFLDSPMPMMIGIWGNDKRYEKMRKTFQKQLQSVFKNSLCQDQKNCNNSKEQLYRVVIDLHKMQIIGTKITLEDCYVLQNLSKYLLSYEKQNQINFLQALQLFIFRTILGENQVKNMVEIHKIDWVRIIKRHIQNSQMYQFYRNSLKQIIL